MTKMLLAVAGLVLLAGCGGKEDVNLTNASIEETAKAADKVTMLRPGQWETKIKIVSANLVSATGGNAAVAKAVTAKMVGQENISSQCITPAQAAQPPVEMITGDNSPNCKFDSFALKDGKLASKLSCGKMGEAGAMVMTTSGNFGGDSYALDTAMTIASPVGKIDIKALNSAKRIGDCKAGAEG
jgi:hypothetical protein